MGVGESYGYRNERLRLEESQDVHVGVVLWVASYRKLGMRAGYLWRSTGF